MNIENSLENVKVGDAIRENRNAPDLASSITDILSQFKIEKVA